MVVKFQHGQRVQYQMAKGKMSNDKGKNVKLQIKWIVKRYNVKWQRVQYQMTKATMSNSQGYNVKLQRTQCQMAKDTMSNGKGSMSNGKGYNDKLQRAQNHENTMLNVNSTMVNGKGYNNKWEKVQMAKVWCSVKWPRSGAMSNGKREKTIYQISEHNSN